MEASGSMYEMSGALQDDLVLPDTFPSIEPSDLAIAVVGMTGVGKSTFISFFNPAALAGDGLESLTQTVGVFETNFENQKLFLIDTPGFDDTNRSDTDVLRELADWLNISYKAQVKLAGIIYLHRINDNRMAGAAMKNLRMFKQLCGDQGLSCVIIATTMWSSNPTPKEISREHELSTKEAFWANMISRGSHVFRQDAGPASATRIIRFIIEQRHRITLQIQEEMASGKALDETAAGREIEAELNKLKERQEREMANLCEELYEAQNQKNTEAQTEIQNLRKELDEKVQAQNLERVRLRVRSQELRQQREEERRRFEVELRHREEILMHQSLMESLATKSEYEAKLIEAEWKAQLYEAELDKYRRADEERKKRGETACVIL